MRRRIRALGAPALGALALSALLAGCGGGPGNDPVAREALVQASVKSAAAESYVAVVDAGKGSAVTFTYHAPDRLRIEQGRGDHAVVVVQVALAGYHSRPGDPGHFTKKLENVPPSTNAPLRNVSALITRSIHVSRKGHVIRFEVPYGDVKAKLLVELDAAGRIADAELPVFDARHKAVSYRRVTFSDYDRAPAVVVPAASAVSPG